MGAVYSTDEDIAPEEELDSLKRRKTGIKLGKIRMADSTLLKRITWLHELMHQASGQPTVYEELTFPSSSLDIWQYSRYIYSEAYTEGGHTQAST